MPLLLSDTARLRALRLESCSQWRRDSSGIRSLPRRSGDPSPRRRESSGRSAARRGVRPRGKPARAQARGPSGSRAILRHPAEAIRPHPGRSGLRGRWARVVDPSGRRFPLPRRLSVRPRQAPRCTAAVGDEAFGGSAQPQSPLPLGAAGGCFLAGPPKTSASPPGFLEQRETFQEELPSRKSSANGGPAPTSVASPCFP